MSNARKKKESTDHHVVLGEHLVMGDIAALHAQLIEALKSASPVTLDAAAVIKVDTSGLQLLHAFVEERESISGLVRWENVGTVLHDAATLAGLRKPLKLPESLPATH